ncbi:hypothetical protein QE250_14755 [Chromatiaceae bacterium AAb-1]|nr:hypothetical protein [Chromatiaceae bacterium AAb-1]
MKQTVNLYVDALKPVKERLSLKRLLMVWLLLMITLLVIWQIQVLKQQQLVADLDAARQQLVLQQKKIEALNGAITQRNPSAAVVSEYNRLLAYRQQQELVLSYLSARKARTEFIPSQIFLHLQAADLPELWLTRFSLEAGQSAFYGISLQPVIVTRWLEGLRQHSYFQGQSFKGVTLQQLPQRPAVSFELIASPKEGV